MATEIIGRDEELASIGAFLDRVQEGPAALVLSGEAGIGKTSLWEAGAAEAEHRFGRVLSHRSAEAEASLSFTGLSDLLAPVFADIAPCLAPPRRRALEVALLFAEPGETAPDPGAIGLAVLDILRALTDRGPVLVTLDDIQWLDSPSAGVLQIALRRLGDEPLGVLATLRDAPDVAAPLALERAFPEERLTRLSLSPLSLGALHRLLAERIGLELTRPEVVRVQETSGGNPFFALELGRELVRAGERPAPGEKLRVPESLRELLGTRLARLPTETGDIVLFAAALARPTIELVMAAHGDRLGVLDALETAAREGVVELDESHLRFAHPLVASLCYEQAPLWKRRAVHRALADVVTDVEERARHLALAAEGPDAAVVSELEHAADQAAGRGATAAAAELCELAAELCLPDPTLTRSLRLRAARFHTFAGDTDRAVTLLDHLLSEVPSGMERAEVLLARALTWRGDTSVLLACCGEALTNAARDDAISARILAIRAWIHIMMGEGTAALADARTALERAERTDDPVLLAMVIGRVAQAESWSAEVTPGLLERGVEIEERLGLVVDYVESPRLYLTRHLMRLGETDRPRVFLEELEERAADRGDETTRMVTLWYLTMLEWLAGRWQRALAHSTAAHELAEQIQHSSGWVARVKALVEVDLGLVERARASAEEGLAHSRASSNELFVIISLGVLGRLELALGNLEAAGGYLRELPGQLLAGGINDPTVPVWADAIETLVALGEVKQAHDYLEPYELHARRLGSPLAIECALRCRGLVAAAEGDVGASFEAFESALREQPEPRWPFERGRTLLCLGTVRRQAQQKRLARGALERALAIFEELGARLWAEKARAELKRVSGRRPPSDELTETEWRVADLAAQGRTNREIAAELYMGVSTVESHLSRVYRKVGVRSRTELSGRIRAPVEAVIPRDEAGQS